MRQLLGAQTPSQDRQEGGRKGSELYLSLAACSLLHWALRGDTGEIAMGLGSDYGQTVENEALQMADEFSGNETGRGCDEDGDARQR